MAEWIRKDTNQKFETMTDGIRHLIASYPSMFTLDKNNESIPNNLEIEKIAEITGIEANRIRSTFAHDEKDRKNGIDTRVDKFSGKRISMLDTNNSRIKTIVEDSDQSKHSIGNNEPVWQSLHEVILPGIQLGEGVKAYTVESITKEQILLRGHPEGQRIASRQENGALRIIPVIVIEDIIDSIEKKVITLDDIIKKYRSDKNLPPLFKAIGLDHDPFILGYDTTIYKLCEFYFTNRKQLQSFIQFDLNTSITALQNTSLKVNKNTITSFIASLLSKPFVILTGLAGSGKTKLAEAFSKWIVDNEREQICMVAVGADWTNKEPLLGYPDALDNGKYVLPENGVVKLLLDAATNENKPYFLILDEMNMSHVERYFADFLSAMESDSREIKLHASLSPLKSSSGQDIPPTLKLGKNVFIIGTVNVDETTYMFSPKVLDRAHVLEFRVADAEMHSYLANPQKINMAEIQSKGSSMAKSFVDTAKSISTSVICNDILNQLFTDLQSAGAEFGYRTAYEISVFAAKCKAIDTSINNNDIIDAAIMQKLLPKVHGSRNRIESVLKTLAKKCLENPELEPFNNGAKPKYPRSYDKLKRMHTRAITDGFTSFAEA